MSEIILVTGATGKQGGAVATHLVATGWRVRALTRDAQSAGAQRLSAAGVEIVTGDLADRATVEAAVRGVHGAFSVQPGALGWPVVPYDDEVRWARNLADACAAAGVEQVVYSSVAGVDRARLPRAFASKLTNETHLRGLGVPWTILRPVSFMDNYVDSAFGVQTGVLATPFAADVPEQLVAVDDIGRLAAQAFREPEQFLSRVVDVVGDQLTPPAIVDALNKAAGRPIAFSSIPIEAVRQQSELVADAVQFLNQTGGYGTDIAATRAAFPWLLRFDEWLTDQGRTGLDELFAMHAATT